MGESGAARTACFKRTTHETDVEVSLGLDGTGKYVISTGIPYFDHMLAHIARHGLFDMEVRALGDLQVDAHHTVEDVGIALGEAFREALGDRKGIRRYGHATLPLDEALAAVTVDISGRPLLVYRAEIPRGCVGDLEMELLPEFFRAFASHARLTLHVGLSYGENLHHMSEAIFKAFGRALDQATSLDPRIAGVVPSTKGTL